MTTDERIINAAVTLFAKSGFNATTVQQIAKRAKINEITIYRRYPRKELLVWATLENRLRMQQRVQELRSMVSKRQHLSNRAMAVFLAENAYDRFFSDPEMVRMLMFAALEGHAIMERYRDEFILPYYELLSMYCREKSRTGEFRKNLHPECCRYFTYMTFSHFLVEKVFHAVEPMEREYVVSGLVDLWLLGAEAR